MLKCQESIQLEPFLQSLKSNEVPPDMGLYHDLMYWTTLQGNQEEYLKVLEHFP